MSALENRSVKKHNDHHSHKGQTNGDHYGAHLKPSDARRAVSYGKSSSPSQSAGIKSTTQYQNATTKQGASPFRQEKQDTEEFAEQDIQRDYVHRDVHNPTDVNEVAEEGQYVDEYGRPIYEEDDVRYAIEGADGKQQFIDEHGNIYIYHNGTGPVNTELRAAQREQMRQEREYLESQIQQKHRQREEERHRAKLEEFANKGKSRAFPYGTNYSQKKEDVNQNELHVDHPHYKKITPEGLNQAIADKSIKEKFLMPLTKSTTKRKASKPELDRLSKSKDKHQCKAFLKVYEDTLNKQSPKKERKGSPKYTPQVVQEVTDRVFGYQSNRLNEMQRLHERNEEKLAQEGQQFKP